MKRPSPTSISTIIALLAMPIHAWAMSLTPIEATLSATGRGTSHVFRLHNDSPDPIAVDLFVKKRAMNRDGSDELTDADNDFTIIPAQSSLQPGQTQSVRIQYVADPNIKGEVAYRFIAEQLPLDTATVAAKSATEATAGVRLIVKYVASVYVSTGKTKAVIAPTSVAYVPASNKGLAHLKVVLKNSGDAHLILKNASLTFTHADNTYTLGADDLKGLEKENILAHTEREFIVPVPKHLKLTGAADISNIQFKLN